MGGGLSEKSIIIVIAFQATTMQMVIVDNFLNILMTKATIAFLSTTENPINQHLTESFSSPNGLNLTVFEGYLFYSLLHGVFIMSMG